MKAIFLDAATQETFERDGFVLLDDFLSNEETSHFKARIAEGAVSYVPYSRNAKTSSIEKRPAVSDAMVFTAFMSESLQKLISAEIKEVAEAHLKRFLKADYKTAMAFGSVKRPSEEEDGSFVPSHVHASKYDPSLSAFPPISIFSPLDDVDESTGPVGFIKGSYRLFGDEVVPLEFDQTENVNHHRLSLVDEHCKYRLLKAGPAILFHSRTIHAGKSAKKSRYALTIDLIPSEANAIFYVTEYDGTGKIVLHGREMPIPSIYNHAVSNQPLGLGEEIHTVEGYEPKTISKDDFLAPCGGAMRTGAASFTEDGWAAAERAR